MDDTQMMAEISNFVAAYFKRYENPLLLSLTTTIRSKWLNG